MGFGEFAESRHETAAVPGPSRQHDMAGLDVLQGDGGDVWAQATAVKAGRNGDRLPGGDDFELVLERVDERAIGCPATVGPGIDAPEGVQAGSECRTRGMGSSAMSSSVTDSLAARRWSTGTTSTLGSS